MTFARFARTEQVTVAGRTMPAYVQFIREINGARPDTFGAPTHEHDKPYPGYETERYPGARVIHGPGDEGVRVVADSPEAVAAFRTVAAELGIHLSDSA